MASRPGPRTADSALLFLVSVPHAQSWGPEQGLQPLALSPAALRANQSPEAPALAPEHTPTEHKGEEGVVAQQQHDTEHGAEAVPRCPLLQLQQPVVLEERRGLAEASKA